MNREGLIKLFSVKLRALFSMLSVELSDLQEIRLRAERAVVIRYCDEDYFVDSKGGLTKKISEGYVARQSEIRETLEYISNYSLYAYEEDIKQGFLTIQGGHRIGVSGKLIMDEGRKKGMKHISFINIRLAHEVRGCADKIMPCLFEKKAFLHTLIISPPSCGKTTLLRDVVRQISDKGFNVGVVDERSEIAACYQGVPQNDVGLRTDVLDCCPKAEGMIMLLRSMAPDVIAVDEIGLLNDIEALRYVFGCGCKILATIHGESLEELKKRPFLESLFSAKLFERYVLIKKSQDKQRELLVYDTDGKRLI